jgi:hypothetical protein
MDLATEEETTRFLSALWLRWSETILRKIATHYKLDTEQKEALIQVLSKPNDWSLKIEGGICSS